MAPVADSESHKAGAFVQMDLGVSVCGARGAANCRKTEPGFTLGGRVGWLGTPWLSVDVDILVSGLPSEGRPPGRFFFAGPGVHGSLPWGAWVLGGGAALGYSRLSADETSVGGFGALRLDAAVTWTVAERFPVGVGYALVRPQGGEVCRDGRCADTEVASMHQFLVVGGARF